MTQPLDQVDQSIIEVLQVDGQLSNREIGRQLNISETTIRKRLRRMEELHLVRLGVVTDVASLGLSFGAFLRLSVIASRVEALAARVAAAESSAYVAITTGRFNVVAYFVSPSRTELMDTIEALVSLDGVREASVLEPARAVKHRYDVIRA